MSYKPSSRQGSLAVISGTAVLTAALLLMAAGCGKQGPPLPPLKAVPATTKDLVATQQGAQIVLAFSYPKTTAAGLALPGVSAVEVLETTRPATPDGKAAPLDPKQFATAAKPQAKVSGADLTAATSGDRIVISLPVPPPPAAPAVPAVSAKSAPASTPTTATTPAPAAPLLLAHYYAVRTFGLERDRSEISNISSVVPKPPPPAPERLTVTARADGVMVEWAGVPGAAGGYNVYRRDAQERFHGQPIHTAGAEERSWLDSTARFGQSYIYTATALAQREPAVESAVGSEHEVRYQDRFPPAVPGDLVALAEPGRIRLVWRSVEAEDLAGYIIYRRIGNGSFERVTAQPVTTPEYVDTALTAGQTYAYRVTSIDKTGNESDPGAEVRAQAP
ncbi:MAG: fibronectin type III domain-containing protein [Thermoanaerobaculia bacterium]